MKRCILDGEKITDKEILHDTLAAELDLPEWYGRNLDALYDCLTDLQEETEIRLLQIAELGKNLGRYAGALERVLRNASEENPMIRLEFKAEI